MPTSPRRQPEPLDYLVVLRFFRFTFEECADQLGVSLRTVKRWSYRADFVHRLEALEQIWRRHGRRLGDDGVDGDPAPADSEKNDV